MANENHERYNDIDISTYTDTISQDNTFSNAQIDSCVLSAGLLPYSAPCAVPIGSFDQDECTGGANSNSPFYKETDTMILWEDESALVSIDTTNYYAYQHIVYVAGEFFNAIATDLQMDYYKNFLTINSDDFVINGVTHKLYYPVITTKYGSNNNWLDSVLSPVQLIRDNDKSIALELGARGVCRWTWEYSHGTAANPLSEHNKQFNLNDASGFTLHSFIWERRTGSAIKIEEGTPTATFPAAVVGAHFTHIYEGGNPLHLTVGFNNEADILLWCAFCGLKFEYNGVTYKPLADNGVVYGYTDDMSLMSEWDEWKHIGDHTIPLTPPVPPIPPYPDKDNEEVIPTAAAPYSSGLARYYVTTAGSTILNHISEAFGAWNLKDSGKDLYKNIISCKLIKSPAPIPVSGSEPFTVYGVTLQYQGADITLPLVNDNPTNSFGPFNISRKFYDFRDFAPYTKVEIYLPFCGWTVLPSHVVGRSVTVTYYTDIIAATCKAVVYCGANVIAEAAGVIGLDIPMVTENAGAKAEAVTMGLLAYGKAGLQTALGVGAAVASKGKVGVKSAVGGLENLVSAYSQTAMAFNQNYTEINGKNGDGCCLGGISAIVIKITRPKYGGNSNAPFVPAEYGHSTGFVSMKSAKVGSFTGLLVADNVDTSGISGATDREKQLIKLYLESGIFVRHPN